MDAFATDSIFEFEENHYHPEPRLLRSPEVTTSVVRTKTSPRKTRATCKRRRINNACNTHSMTRPFSTPVSPRYIPSMHQIRHPEQNHREALDSLYIRTMTEKGTKSHRNSVPRRIDTRFDHRYPIERAPHSPPLPSRISPRLPRLLPRFPGFPIASQVRARLDRLGISEGRRLRIKRERERHTGAFSVVYIMSWTVFGVRNVSIQISNTKRG